MIAVGGITKARRSVILLRDDLLASRWPEVDLNERGAAANEIDGLVRDMAQHEHGYGVVGSLKRLQARANAPSKPHLFAKAWAAMPADALALLDQARCEPDGLPEWQTLFRAGPNFLPIPHPGEVTRYLPAAIILASARGRWPRWRRDRTVQAIARLHQRATGQTPRSSGSLEFVEAVREFYAGLKPSIRFDFAVQDSSHTKNKIFRD